jgi:hypothetical protein
MNDYEFGPNMPQQKQLYDILQDYDETELLDLELELLVNEYNQQP